MEVNYEQLLQYSNQMKNFIEKEVASLSNELLNWKESEKEWSIIEVVSHLNKVYDKYHDNFETAIKNAPELSGESPKKQSTIIGRLSIYSMKPKGKKRKFKMKTFDFFEPQIDENHLDETLQLFIQNKHRFNAYLKDSRLKNLKGVKMPTALGEKMKFYIPECFDFILSHEERHMVQIEDLIKRGSK